MTKPIVAVLAALLALLTLVTAAEAAPRGKYMYAGMESPQQFADIFQQYRDRDPTGTSLIDARKCANEASCGTGQAIIEGILASDPDASVNGVLLRSLPTRDALALVPAFLRKLEARDPAPGIYWSDCMIRTTDREQFPSGWKRLAHCAHNEFKPGEKAFVDPDTGRTVMKQGCKNTGVQLEQKKTCVYTMIPVEIGDIVIMQGHGPRDITHDDCTGLLLPGETEWESPAVERCEHPYCEIDTGGTAIREEQWKGSFQAEQSGWAILRQDAEVAQEGSEHQTYYCNHRGNTTFYGLGVRWDDFINRTDSRIPEAGPHGVAIIQPDYATAFQVGRATRNPKRLSILWWETDFSHFKIPSIASQP